MWIEQSYKQVKHVLGWSDYQVRSDRAIRRHWQLVCCAFGFCWHQHRPAAPDQGKAATAPDQGKAATAPEAEPAAQDREKNGRRATKPPNGRLAAGAAGGARVAGAVDHAGALLARVVAGTPTASTPTPA